MSGKQPLKLALLLPPLLVAISVAVALYLQNSFSEKAGKNYRISGINIMGTLASFIVSCPPDQHDKAQEAVQQAIKDAKRIEFLMSRFNPESDISRINSAAAGEWITIDPLTWQALSESMRYHILTDGAFDPGIGELMTLYHFSRTEENALPPRSSIEKAHLAGGISKLEFQREGMKVRRTNARVQIDLGGIAKGMGVDIALKRLRSLGFNNCVVEIGGEVHASGMDMQTGAVFSDKSRSTPWKIWIKSPSSQTVIDSIEASGDLSVATSGDYEKFFEMNGKRYSHIIDPKTGHPVTGGIISASIISPVSCMQADALATSASILGEEKFRKLLAYFPGVRAILIMEDSSRIDIKASEFPEKERQLFNPQSELVSPSFSSPAAPSSRPPLPTPLKREDSTSSTEGVVK